MNFDDCTQTMSIVFVTPNSCQVETTYERTANQIAEMTGARTVVLDLCREGRQITTNAKVHTFCRN